MKRDQILRPGDFFSISNEVAKNKKLTASAKLVYGVLGDHLGKNDVAWPGEAGIAERLGLDRKTVSRAVMQLEANGWLHIRPRDGDTNVYTLLVPSTVITQIQPSKEQPPDNAGEHGTAEGFERSDKSGDTEALTAQDFKQSTAQPAEQYRNVPPTSTKMSYALPRNVPGSGTKMSHELLQGTTSRSTQGKSTTPLAASPPAVAPAPAWVPASLDGVMRGKADALGASPAVRKSTEVADAAEHPVPAPALPLPVQPLPSEKEPQADLSAASQAEWSEFQQAVAQRRAELAAGAKPDAGTDKPLEQDDGEAEAQDDYDRYADELNEWDGTAEQEDEDAEASLVAA